MAQVYTRDMPVDIDATVMGNRRLSADYNVLAIDAPEIASRARPGQFVMMKTSRGLDPLLRRPFSIFEILRDDGGAPRGVSLLNKTVGGGTSLLYQAESGARLACLGPLGRPFEPVGATERTSRPASIAVITSACPGRNASRLTISRSSITT